MLPPLPPLLQSSDVFVFYVVKINNETRTVTFTTFVSNCVYALITKSFS